MRAKIYLGFFSPIIISRSQSLDPNSYFLQFPRHRNFYCCYCLSLVSEIAKTDRVGGVYIKTKVKVTVFSGGLL